MMGWLRKNKAPSKGRSKSNANVNPRNAMAAIQKLRETQGNIDKRAAFLRKKVQVQTNKAKAALKNKNKAEALAILKKKKIYEKEVATLETSSLTMEEQILRIEGTSALSDVVGALDLANQVMANLNQKLDADRVEEVLAAGQEYGENLNEIQELMGEGQELDDPDLLEALEDLSTDMAEENLMSQGLPSAVADTSDEDISELASLKQLQRQDSMALLELQKMLVPESEPVPKKQTKARTADEEEFEQLAAAML